VDDVTTAAIAPDAGAYEGSFVVELAHFNGPLDLLLSLLRDEKIQSTTFRSRASASSSSCACATSR